MKNSELESWVLSIIESAKKNQRIEDSRVELKSELIDHHKAARRIAGHANASNEDYILWIIGLYENGEIKSIENKSVEDWLNKVFDYFDGVHPELLKDLNILYEGQTIVALLFSTDRAPYLVSSEKGGKISWEIPYRNKTEIKTANRSELLRILSPIQNKMNAEIHKLEVKLNTVKENEKYDLSIESKIMIYFDGKFNNQSYVTFPNFRTDLIISIGDYDFPLTVRTFQVLQFR